MKNNLIFPKYLSIQTTSFCNANCIFCPNHEVKRLFPPKVMEDELFKKIIDECKAQPGIERIILYLNNEPLTDAHIIERINYAKETVPWASVHILTNGSLLDDKIQEALINSKLDWIGISIHGIKKQSVEGAMGLDYDTVFPRILRFIQKAKSKRDIKDFLMVTFLNHKYLTAGEKEEAINFWKEQGISRISFFDGPISRAGNVRSMPQVYHPKISGCRSIWANEMIHIVENGDVVICCMDWKREEILGNLRKQSISEIWNSSYYAQVRDQRDGRREAESNFICKRCEESIVPQEDFMAKPNSDLSIGKTEEIPPDKTGPVNVILGMVPPWQTKMPPLGLAYLSSFLRSHGIKTKIIDLNVKLFNNSTQEKRHFWEIATLNNFTPEQIGRDFCAAFNDQIEDFIAQAAESEAPIIGLSTTIASLNVAISIAHKIKQKTPSKVVVLGGPGVFWNTKILDPNRKIDVFVIGEGELPMLEIIKRFQKEPNIGNLAGIPGTIVQLNGKYHDCSTPDPLRNIDEVPLVDFLGFDLDEYDIIDGYRPLPILISRGCVNHCSFCIDHKMNAPFRFRDPQKVFDELKYYNQKFGVRNFEFNDLLCNGNLRQLESICDLIIKERLGVRWHSYAAIRMGMTEELFKKMRSAGCSSLCFGMESASDVVLKKMNKSFNSAIAEQVIRDSCKAGIATSINIIVGYPGETAQEFKKTCEFIKRNKESINEITNVSTCVLMPETDLIKHPDKFGIYFKQSFRDRLRTFFKHAPVQCNYRKFYALPDNSPRMRGKRLREMLLLITKLNIPYVIVNRLKEDDPGFEKVFPAKKACLLATVSAGLLRVKFDPAKKRAYIFYNNQSLTADVGLNTSFNIQGKWFDSSTGIWQVNSEADRLFTKITFRDFPIVQDWTIKLNKDSLVWEIKTLFGEKLRVDQQKFGMVFTDQYNKYSAGELSAEFPPVDDQWREVNFFRKNQINLITAGDLPKINFRQEGFREKIPFVQLQNLPFAFFSRMVNFCLIDPVVNAENEKKWRIFKKGATLNNSFKITLAKE
ncbi:MAG TPA: radical SAM protein [Candidatus Omnitrophota bacterium]|mgnify:CR=1 FL=1|nr:radical SAM protein [Candidatus Omnitrophota bacterium]HPT39224.1 radical SAM protein [Candidatus Omnitrophota bacterium]